MISLKFIPSASLARPLWPNICRTLSTVPAKPAGASLSIGKKRFRLPTEKNVDKLVSHCCGANYFKEGEEIKLKDDSEYPEWLWELPLKPPHLHELDPNTKEYWERAEVVGKQREWRLQSLAEKKQMIVSEVMINNLKIHYRRRFRALAKYHYNAGHDIVEHHEREDIWNMHAKEALRLPEKSEPFYPGVDEVQLPYEVRQMNLFRNDKKIGHFGQ